MSEQIDVERLTRALATTLAEDGYIDLSRDDGRKYLEGDRTATASRDIEYTAEKIAEAYAGITGLLDSV